MHLMAQAILGGGPKAHRRRLEPWPGDFGARPRTVLVMTYGPWGMSYVLWACPTCMSFGMSYVLWHVLCPMACPAPNWHALCPMACPMAQ